MQDEIWHQFGIQNYNGNVLSVYSVIVPVRRPSYLPLFKEIPSYFKKDLSHTYINSDSIKYVNSEECEAKIGNNERAMPNWWAAATEENLSH